MAALNSTRTDPAAAAASSAAVQAFTESITAPVGFVLVSTSFAAMLVPLLVVLFYFSTATSRRRPVFVLNVASVILGILIAVWSDYLLLTSVLHPFQYVSISNTATFVVFFGFAPWLVELVLVARLLAVFPPSIYSWRQLAAILAVPAAAKAVRLAVLVIYYRSIVISARKIGVPYGVGESIDYRHLPYMKIEWSLQILDTGYCSFVFIWRLRQTCRLNTQSLDGVMIVGKPSISTKVRTLFWVALQNFVVPFFLNIALLVDLYVDPNYHANTTYLLFTNYYVSIISVLFATIWSSSFAHRHRPSTDDAERSLSFVTRDVHALQSATTHEDKVAKLHNSSIGSFTEDMHTRSMPAFEDIYPSPRDAVDRPAGGRV